jgi:peptide/nickel transport system substrate-binding protein
MKRRNTVAAIAVGAGLVMLASACGSGGGATNSSAGYGAANTGVVNASNKTGGTLTYGISDAPDSTDPGNTYYAYTWDLVRLYSRPLLGFKPAPGNAGLQVVPDLATGLGQVSDNGLTWTYHIRPDVKFEDGTTVTTKDVKYAIERSTNYAPDVLPNGPTYFQQYLADPTYPGAYKDTTPGKMGLTSVDTPDATTIVFHLTQPFADFDYLVTNPQTAPVPEAKDTGANYQEHPMSTGPYKFSSFKPDQSFTLVKNPEWSASTDPNRKQLADTINVLEKVNADDLDNRLIDGSIQIDMAGTGLQAAGRSKVLQDPNLKKNADDTLTGRTWYINLDTQVAPLNNLHCRMAIEYAVDKVADQTAYGGPVAGGDIASTVLPPDITGYQPSDMYEAASHPHGDLVKAKSELQACGQPNGFTTNISARSDRPFEVSAAQAVQQQLKKVGITTDIQQFPHSKYFSDFAGVPAYVHQHDLGIMMMGWQADWPTGFGFLQQIADGRSIKPAGNSNLAEENNPQINALFDKASSSNDANTRNQIYGQIDKLMMQDAVFVPEVYAKELDYRNPKATNVYVSQAYGMYDYTQIGVGP